MEKKDMTNNYFLVELWLNINIFSYFMYTRNFL